MSARFDLDTLERLAEKATPGPWWVDEPNQSVRNPDVDIADFSFDWEACQDDAAYVAACDPATVTALVRAVREAQRFADGDGSLAELVAALVASETGEAA